MIARRVDLEDGVRVVEEVEVGVDTVDGEVEHGGHEVHNRHRHDFLGGGNVRNGEGKEEMGE